MKNTYYSNFQQRKIISALTVFEKIQMLFSIITSARQVPVEHLDEELTVQL